MPILIQLYPTLRLRPDSQHTDATLRPPVTETDLNVLLSVFPQAPSDCLELLSAHDGMVFGSDKPDFVTTQQGALRTVS